MTAAHAIVYAIDLGLIGAVFVWMASANKTTAGWFNFLITAASSGLAFIAAGQALLNGPNAVTVWELPVFASSLRIYVDGLAALFLALIALIAFLAALYSVTYMKHYPEYGAHRYYPWFQLFVAGMYGIVTTTDLMLFFCAFWQLMTIPSYFLIRYESRQRDNVRAANKYLIMMEISCLLVMIGGDMLVALLPQGTPEKYDFDTLARHMPDMLRQNHPVVAGALALFLVGFGIKAGMWPFGQMWLPDAHPAAPSPVSALLSGVMIKTGVYGLMRVFLWLIPKDSLDYFPSQTWGFILAVLGTITLFIGTAQALQQEQSKRLLAFHSIGQVGYILLGLGACLALINSHHPKVCAFATAAFLGAIYHTLNHGTFKSLLFMNAGAMRYATGTQDLNRMGGLMKYMPVTALATLIASFSIAGVPLCNGFASKWSIYVAALSGSQWAPYLAVCGVIAILTSVLTLASFMKFFGVSFLSRTSKLVGEKVSRNGTLEVDMLMQIPQAVLASLCLIMGMLPLGMMLIFMQAVGQSQAPHVPESAAALLAIVPPPMAMVPHLFGAANQPAAFFPPTLMVLLATTFLIAWAISRLGGARRRAATIWLCGYVREADNNRYNAHNLYGEVKRYFRWTGGAPRHPADSAKDDHSTPS